MTFEYLFVNSFSAASPVSFSFHLSPAFCKNRTIFPLFFVHFLNWRIPIYAICILSVNGSPLIFTKSRKLGHVFSESFWKHLALKIQIPALLNRNTSAEPSPKLFYLPFAITRRSVFRRLKAI